MIIQACCLLAGLVWAPLAGASVTPIVPPGNSAGNQYVETLPGPTGSKPLSPALSTSGATPAGSAGLVLTPRQQQALANRGEAGRIVRDLAPRSRPRIPVAALSAKPASPTASVSQLIGGRGPGGLGIALPVILGVATVAATGFGLRRRRG